jgi:hypothetical protein
MPGGVNTTKCTTAPMALCLHRGSSLGFFIVQWIHEILPWMGEPQLLVLTAGLNPNGPSVARCGGFATALSSTSLTVLSHCEVALRAQF